MARLSIAQAGNMRRLAFLDTIAACEFGAAMLADPAGDDGYCLIVGSLPDKLIRMADYKDHPQHPIYLKSYGVYSTAAGRYQFLARTWEDLVAVYHYPDFSPANQDIGALALIRERGGLELIDTGRLEDALIRCHNIWASLPGATYGQQVRSMDFCRAANQHALDTYAGNTKPDFSNVLAGVETTANVPAWTLPRAA